MNNAKPVITKTLNAIDMLGTIIRWAIAIAIVAGGLLWLAQRPVPPTGNPGDHATVYMNTANGDNAK